MNMIIIFKWLVLLSGSLHLQGQFTVDPDQNLREIIYKEVSQKVIDNNIII